MKLSIRKKIIFSLITFGLLFGVLECALRVFGFQRNMTVETMSFTFPVEEYNTNSAEPFLERDERLFWKPRPYVLEHNSRGLVGPEFKDQKDPGVFRIVCLGDSCTHFGPQPYTEHLQELLDQRMPGRFEVINCGTIGYSSHQGLVRLQDEVTKWEPDLVTVYFGWNDHWLAHFFRDSEQQVAGQTKTEFHNSMSHSRVYQLINLCATKATTSIEPKYRVSTQEYATNLREMKQISDQIGSRIWYLTAPHAFDIGVPDYLSTSGEVIEGEDLLELHRSYNEVVRSEASESGVTLVDLEQELDKLDKFEIFVDDHIHLSEQGRFLVGKRLFDQLAADGFLELEPESDATSPERTE